MTQHRFLNICLAMAIAAVLALSFHLDDGAEATVDVLSEAQAQARRDLRHDLAAARMCRKEHGAGSTFVHTADGSLVCIPRNQIASAQP